MNALLPLFAAPAAGADAKAANLLAAARALTPHLNRSSNSKSLCGGAFIV